MSDDYRDHQCKQALALHQEGNFVAAQGVYAAILERSPRDVAVLHLLGILVAQQNDYILAASYLTRALAIEPASPLLLNSMGNILKNSGEFAAALSHYQKALRAQPDNAVLHNNIAIVQQKMGQVELALDHYRVAVKLQPNYADAHYNLSLLLMHRHDLETALTHLKATIELKPLHAQAHCQLAQLYQHKNDVAAALNHYQKAIRIDKTNAIAQHNLGTLLLQKNKHAAAIVHFKKVLQLEPLHREAFYNLGVIFLLQNDPEAALKYFLRLSQLEKEDFDVYYNLGVIYNMLNRFKEAIEYFNAALLIRADDFAAHINLGALYLKEENYKVAQRHYAAALALQPDNKEIAYILTGITQNDCDENEERRGGAGAALASLPPLPPLRAPEEYVQHLFDNYAATYDKHLALLEYQAPQLLYDALRATVSPLPYKSWKIIDLGCGTGLCGEKFHAFARELIGVDLSKKMLEIARQKNIYAELQQGEIEDVLPQYGDGDIDLIVAADTFTYIGDLENIFALCQKALKNGSGASIVADTGDAGFFAFTVEKYLGDGENCMTNVSSISENISSENRVSGCAPKCDGYILQRSLRFAHSVKYIAALAQQYNFQILLHQRAIIRKHRATNTECLVYVLRQHKC